MSIKHIFLVALFFILAITSINAEESDESRKLKAESADKQIRFITEDEFSVHIKEGLWIIMFGANWCKYTQKLTPKWLNLQNRIRSENLNKEINIAKVECTENMKFCTSQGIDGFPTIYVYENGKKYEEYLGNHEINEMFTYVQEQVARYRSEEIVEEIVTVYVEEGEYEDEMEENMPRKSSREEGEQYQKSQQHKGNSYSNSKQLPKKRSSNNGQPTKNENNNNNNNNNNNININSNNTNEDRSSSQNQDQNEYQYQNEYQDDDKQYEKDNSNKAPNYAPPNYASPRYDDESFSSKEPNVVVKATKKVFGLVESLVTLAVVLVAIYAIVRFKAIKRHSSYSKTNIPLYRDLSQEEQYMLHYS